MPEEAAGYSPNVVRILPSRPTGDEDSLPADRDAGPTSTSQSASELESSECQITLSHLLHLLVAAHLAGKAYCLGGAFCNNLYTL